MAEDTTPAYGDSVLLNITAVSANPTESLSSTAIYTGYIYGGDLPNGFSIQLYPSEGEDTFPAYCAILFKAPPGPNKT